MKRYVHPDGSIVEAAVVTVLVESDGPEPYFFSQLQDVTDQRRAGRQKDAISLLGRCALESTDAVALIEDAMGMVRETLGAANCITNRWLASGEIRNVAAAGELPEFAIPAGKPSQSAYTLRVGEPVISNDLADETRFRCPACWGRD